MDIKVKNWILENSANLVTFVGLYGAICNLVIAIFYHEQLAAMTIITILVIFTDWADGKIARDLKEISEFGAALDPLRDKVLVAPTLIIIFWRHRWIVAGISANLMIPIIGLIGLLLFIESILFVGWWMFLIAKKSQISSKKWGKAKTDGEFVVIILWLIPLMTEKYLETSLIQYFIYPIGLGLIVTNILAYITFKTYHKEYLAPKEEKGPE